MLILARMGLNPAYRCPGLREPADPLIDLCRLAMGSHRRTQTAQERAQRGTRPLHAMLRRPATDAFSQRGGGEASVNTPLISRGGIARAPCPSGS
jgi:hypothetical protein